MKLARRPRQCSITSPSVSAQPGSRCTKATATSESLPGVPRSFHAFTEAAREAGLSRIYAGIHWSFDVAAGWDLGRNVGECFVKLYFLERACQAQIMALSAGENVNRPPQGAAEQAAEQGAVGLKVAANLLAWPALKRKVYRLDPNFAT